MVQKTMVQYIEPDSVESFHVASGIMGGMGINKGGVAVALRYRGTPIAFVASHLAARATAKRNRRRNKDVRNIIENCNIGLKNIDMIHQYNVFWLGDLNYRLNLEWDAAVALVKKRDWPTLRQHDQLLIEKAAGRVFMDFQELPLDFPPTYKYVDFKHTCVWEPVGGNGGARVVGHICRSVPATESSKSLARELGVSLSDGEQFFFMPANTKGLRREYTTHKMQTPSWTDRILFRPLPGTVIRQESSGCVDEIQTSDHSPVYATYSFRVPLPPPADVQFMKCMIQVGDVVLTEPRYAGEDFDEGELDEEEEVENEAAEAARRHHSQSSSQSATSNAHTEKKTTDSKRKQKKADDARTRSQWKRRSSSAGGKNEIGVSSAAGGMAGAGAGARKTNKRRRARRSITGAFLGKVENDPILAMHLPFLRGITRRTAYKTAPKLAKRSVALSGGEAYTWNTHDVPSFGPFFTKSEFLEKEFLIFRVQGNPGSGPAGNTIGFATLSLAPMANKHKPVPFDVNLLRGGQAAGRLSGTVQIKWLDASNDVISEVRVLETKKTLTAMRSQQQGMPKPRTSTAVPGARSRGLQRMSSSMTSMDSSSMSMSMNPMGMGKKG